MIKLLSLFSGIGAFEKALKNQHIPFELLNYCEFDKYASKSYSLIHNEPESKNLGDITKVDVESLPSADLICYGFPCQDISLAGKQKGLFNDDGSQTRSGLFFNALKIIEHCKPKVAIAENVKNLTSKKFEKEFKIVLDSLDAAGYNNHWKILKSSDYGIPQKRERVFIVSIRKDLDTGVFEFPEPYELKLRLKDLLEDEVDEKYYLSESMFKYAFNIEKEAKGIGFPDSVDKSFINPAIAQTIGCRSAYGQRSGTSNYVSDAFDEPLQVSEMKKMLDEPECIQVMNLNRPKYHDFSNRVYSVDGIARTLMGSGGNNNDKAGQYLIPLKRGYSVEVSKEQEDTDEIDVIGNYSKSNYQATAIVGKNGIAPTVRENHGQVTAIVTPILGKTEDGYIVRNANSKGYDIAQDGDTVDFQQPSSTTRRGRVGHGVCQTLDTGSSKYVVENPPLRIRRLTPKECFRLQGFDDCDHDVCAKGGISQGQLYKMAGNSITVDVVEELFCMLFDEEGELYI